MTSTTLADMPTLRTFLGLGHDAKQEDIFIAAHHWYHESQPHIDREYGLKYYAEYVETGAIPFFMRRALEDARKKVA